MKERINKMKNLRLLESEDDLVDIFQELNRIGNLNEVSKKRNIRKLFDECRYRVCEDYEVSVEDIFWAIQKSKEYENFYSFSCVWKGKTFIIATNYIIKNKILKEIK